ncbi:hypothetical protein EN856_37440, partial [Mesorhizobium sp. M8A.F.Ca.ET.213.01.1.1]
SFGDIKAWAKAHTGVAGVFTAADIAGKNCFGVIGPFADQPALAEGFARFRGEAVALVAETEAGMVVRGAAHENGQCVGREGVAAKFLGAGNLGQAVEPDERGADSAPG